MIRHKVTYIFITASRAKKNRQCYYRDLPFSFPLSIKASPDLDALAPTSRLTLRPGGACGDGAGHGWSLGGTSGHTRLSWGSRCCPGWPEDKLLWPGLHHSLILLCLPQGFHWPGRSLHLYADCCCLSHSSPGSFCAALVVSAGKKTEKQGLEKQLPTERYNTKIYVEKEEEKRKFNKMNSSWVLLPNVSV